MRRGEENNTVNNVLLRQSILQSIAYLQSKVYIQEKEVYELVRAFFKEYLGLDYEFTHEELLIELQNVFYDKKLEDQVLEFLRKVSRVEYSDDEYKPEELKKILEEFGKIVDLLIKKKTKTKSFLKKLIFWKEHKDEEIPVEKEEEDEIADVIEDMEKDVSLDEKKGLFGKDKKIPESRIIEDKKEEKKEEGKEEKEVKEKQEKEEDKPKSVSSSLAALTADLNDHIERTREYPKREEKKKEEKTESKKELEENSSSKEVIPDPFPIKEKPSEETIPEESDEEDVINEAIIAEDKPRDKKPKTIKHLLKEMKKDPSIEIYQEIQNMYSAMPPEEQKKYYNKVMDAYNKVNKG